VNVVDSCGWLEHLIGGSNSHFFEPILADQDRLLIPQLVIYEVCCKSEHRVQQTKCSDP